MIWQKIQLQNFSGEGAYSESPPTFEVKFILIKNSIMNILTIIFPNKYIIKKKDFFLNKNYPLFYSFMKNKFLFIYMHIESLNFYHYKGY